MPRKAVPRREFSLVYHLQPTFFHRFTWSQTRWEGKKVLIFPGVAQSAAGSMVGLNSAGPRAAFVHTHAPQYPYWTRSSGFRIQRRDACGPPWGQINPIAIMDSKQISSFSKIVQVFQISYNDHALLLWSHNKKYQSTYSKCRIKLTCLTPW